MESGPGFGDCNGTGVYTTRTDPKGNFAISPAPAPVSVNQHGDAERQMETYYEGCRCRPPLPVFTPRRLRLPSTICGTIRISGHSHFPGREGRTAGTAVSATIESAPASAVKSFDKARTELLEQKPDSAEHELEKAVQIYPSFAEAWYQLGRLQQASGSADAEKSYSNATKADPQFVLPPTSNSRRSMPRTKSGRTRRTKAATLYSSTPPALPSSGSRTL